MRARLPALLLLAAACDVAPRAGPGIAGGPLPPIAAQPSGKALTATIGPEGNSLTLDALTVTVPAGAVATPVDFTLDELTPDTAPGAVGNAYRIGPASVALAAPLLLTWAVADPAGLAASHQNAAGYWFREYNVTAGAGTVSVASRAVGDWSLVSTATQLDLHGPFAIQSTTQGVPFTASGEVTLQYIGEEPGFVYYIPAGTITLSASGCDPVATADLPMSIAEIHFGTSQPYQFRWGLNGQWTLNCGAMHPFVSAGFDTMGIDNPHCSLAYDQGVPVYTSPAHLGGRYVIDCGVLGSVVGAWDLVPPGQTPGTPPL